MLPFLRLIRPWNLFIVILTMYMVRYCIVSPILISWGMHLVMPDWLFALLVLAVVMIAAAGYVINDYFDVRIDRINKPDEVVVDKGVKRRVAMIAHFVINALGVLLGIFVSWRSSVFSAGALIFVFAASALWFYSIDFKRKFLIGNVVISLLSAMIVMLPAFYELPFITHHFTAADFAQQDVSYNSIFKVVMALTLFAFLLSWIRELIKDMEDAEGDNAFGCKTFPIVMGMRASRILGGFLIAVVLGMMIILLIAHPEPEPGMINYSWWYILGLSLLSLFLGILLIRAKEKQHFRRASMFTKAVMMCGICYWLLFAWLIHSGTWIVS